MMMKAPLPAGMDDTPEVRERLQAACDGLGWEQQHARNKADHAQAQKDAEDARREAERFHYSRGRRDGAYAAVMRIIDGEKLAELHKHLIAGGTV